MIFNFYVPIDDKTSAISIRNRFENNPLLSSCESTLSSKSSLISPVKDFDSIIYYNSVFKGTPLTARIKLRYDDAFVTFSYVVPQEEICDIYGHCLMIVSNFFPDAEVIKDDDDGQELSNQIEFLNTFGFIPVEKMYAIEVLKIKDYSTVIIATVGLKRLGRSDVAIVVNKEDNDINYAIQLIHAVAIGSITGEWKDVHNSSFEIAESTTGEKLEVSLLSIDALENNEDYALAQKVFKERGDRYSHYVPVLANRKKGQFEKGRFPRDYVHKACSMENMAVRISSKEMKEYLITSTKFMPLAKEILNEGEPIKIFFRDTTNESSDAMFFSHTAKAYKYHDGYFLVADRKGKIWRISEKDVFYWISGSFHPSAIPDMVNICTSLAK